MFKAKRNGLIVGLLFFVLGVLVGFAAINTSKSNKDKKENYVPVEATVVKVDITENEDSANTVRTTLTYEVNGQKYTVETTSIKLTQSDTGKKINVMYNPNKIDQIYYDDNNSSVKFLIFVAIGLSFAGLVVLINTFALMRRSGEVSYDQTNINNVSGPNTF